MPSPPGNGRPAAYKDDWLRQPAQRRGRHCLRPEVLRSYHFGSIGTNFSTSVPPLLWAVREDGLRGLKGVLGFRV